MAEEEAVSSSTDDLAQIMSAAMAAEQGPSAPLEIPEVNTWLVEQRHERIFMELSLHMRYMCVHLWLRAARDPLIPASILIRIQTEVNRLIDNCLADVRKLSAVLPVGLSQDIANLECQSNRADAQNLLESLMRHLLRDMATQMLPQMPMH